MTTRIFHTVDRPVFDLLRQRPRGNEAEDQLWQHVPKHQLPWWLWRHKIPAQARARMRMLRRRTFG